MPVKKYNVKNIDFEIPTGSIACIIGTSGCGKTTTLKMLNRLVEPSTGEIRVNNELLNMIGLDPSIFAQRYPKELSGASGLGDPIFRGVATVNGDLIFLGAVPSALLAIMVDKFWGFVENKVISPGLRL